MPLRTEVDSRNDDNGKIHSSNMGEAQPWCLFVLFSLIYVGPLTSVNTKY